MDKEIQEKEEILPCPFCGEIKIEIESYTHKTAITCMNIDCLMEVCTDWCKTQKEAIEIWNNRAE